MTCDKYGNEDDAGSANHSWHLDKRVNISHLLATFALALALFSWASAIDRRVVILEQRVEYGKEVDAHQEKALDVMTLVVREELRMMNAKLDRVIEIHGEIVRRTTNGAGKK